MFNIGAVEPEMTEKQSFQKHGKRIHVVGVGQQTLINHR